MSNNRAINSESGEGSSTGDELRPFMHYSPQRYFNPENDITPEQYSRLQRLYNQVINHPLVRRHPELEKMIKAQLKAFRSSLGGLGIGLAVATIENGWPDFAKEEKVPTMRAAVLLMFLATLLAIAHLQKWRPQTIIKATNAFANALYSGVNATLFNLKVALALYLFIVSDFTAKPVPEDNPDNLFWILFGLSATAGIIQFLSKLSQHLPHFQNKYTNMFSCLWNNRGIPTIRHTSNAQLCSSEIYALMASSYTLGGGDLVEDLRTNLFLYAASLLVLIPAGIADAYYPEATHLLIGTLGGIALSLEWFIKNNDVGFLTLLVLLFMASPLLVKIVDGLIEARRNGCHREDIDIERQDSSFRPLTVALSASEEEEEEEEEVAASSSSLPILNSTTGVMLFSRSKSENNLPALAATPMHRRSASK